MMPALRRARAPVDRRSCQGRSLSGSPSGLAGIAILRIHPSATHVGEPISTYMAPLRVHSLTLTRRGMPPRSMTELPGQSRSRLTALVTDHGQPGKCIQRLGDDFTEDAVVDLTSLCEPAAGW